MKNRGNLYEGNTIKRDYCYHKVVYDPVTPVIESFELNEKRVTKARGLSGFFAIMTHGLDSDAMKAFWTYQLRDEEEKCFGQMKSQMVIAVLFKDFRSFPYLSLYLLNRHLF